MISYITITFSFFVFVFFKPAPLEISALSSTLAPRRNTCLEGAMNATRRRGCLPCGALLIGTILVWNKIQLSQIDGRSDMYLTPILYRLISTFDRGYFTFKIRILIRNLEFKYVRELKQKLVEIGFNCSAERSRDHPNQKRYWNSAELNSQLKSCLTSNTAVLGTLTAARKGARYYIKILYYFLPKIAPTYI